jgi:putative membrane protein
MKYKLLIMVSGGVFALTACNRNQDATTNTDLNVAIDNSMEANVAEAGPTMSQDFVNAAAASDKFEIESSKLAAAAGASAAVKRFAESMISAHTDSTAKLKSTVAGMKPPLTPDDSLNADQQTALDGLKGKTGAAFDTAYAAAQVDAHQKTLDSLKAYSAAGDNVALKSFADGLIPTVTAHLTTAKGLK